MSEEVIENVDNTIQPIINKDTNKKIEPALPPIQPKKGYSMFDDTAGAVKSVATTLVEIYLVF